MNALTNIHKKVSTQLKNPTVMNVLRALLVVMALTVKNMPTNLLNVYQSLNARVVVAVLVAYLVYIDPILAVLVTVVFVISVHESNNRRVANGGSVQSVESLESSHANNARVNNEVLEDEYAKVLDVVSTDESLPFEGENPVDKTLSENISLEDPSYRQLDVVQSNNITGTDPDEPVKSFSKTNDAQGLSFVKGHNMKSPNSSKF